MVKEMLEEIENRNRLVFFTKCLGMPIIRAAEKLGINYNTARIILHHLRHKGSIPVPKELRIYERGKANVKMGKKGTVLPTKKGRISTDLKLLRAAVKTRTEFT